VDQSLWTVSYYIFRQVADVRGTLQQIQSAQVAEYVCIVHGADVLCLQSSLLENIS
jgi:hypothetical protein